MNHGERMVREGRLANAYYARVADLKPSIKKRVSVEMLREIFDRMVAPAYQELTSQGDGGLEHVERCPCTNCT